MEKKAIEFGFGRFFNISHFTLHWRWIRWVDSLQWQNFSLLFSISSSSSRSSTSNNNWLLRELSTQFANIVWVDIVNKRSINGWIHRPLSFSKFKLCTKTQLIHNMCIAIPNKMQMFAWATWIMLLVLKKKQKKIAVGCGILTSILPSKAKR